LNLNPERIEAARNFANKIWNITRFVLSKLDHQPPTTDHRRSNNTDGVASSVVSSQSSVVSSLADRWILSRYNRLVAEVDRLMRAYNFGEAGRQIQEFLWSEFADWYVEVAKVQLESDEQRQRQTRAVLYTVLEGSLRLLHPFMPFVTEEAWQYLTAGLRAEGRGLSEAATVTQSSVLSPQHSIMVAPYPTADAGALDETADRDWVKVQDLITGIRNVRNEYKVEPARFVAATIAAGAQAGLLEAQRSLIARLARVADEQLAIVERLDSKPAQAAALVVGGVEVFLPLAGLIDMAAERARLSKELETAQAEVVRREAKLGNAGFVDKAPPMVVQRERDGLAAAQAAAERLRERLEQLG
jgi:valyl-tRNA synthetase